MRQGRGWSAQPEVARERFDIDREVFRSVVPQRARRQAGVIRRLAAAGDPACVALLPIAGLLESSAVDVEALPRDFWLR